MPYKSKKQWNKFFAMANEGKIPLRKAKEWAKKTKTPFKQLPDNASNSMNKKSFHQELAFELGVKLAYLEAGLH